MQRTRCPLCSSDDAQIVATKADYVEDLVNVVCRRCGLVYIDPVPTKEDLDSYYHKQFIQERHHIASVDEARERAKNKKSLEKYPVDSIKRFLSADSKVLEIGCGYGFFLKRIKDECGAQVFGVEPSEVSGKFAAEEYGIEVFHGLLDDYLSQADGRKFDMIIMHHVLEHISEPVAALKRLTQKLSPGGKFYIVVPNVTELQEPVEAFFQYPHVVSYSPWSLNHALNLSGLKTISLNPRLRPPRSGLEAVATRFEEPENMVKASAFSVGSEPSDVVRVIRKAKLVYGLLRGVKGAVERVVPGRFIQPLSLKVRRLIRKIGDSF
ncbi:MAG: class I SAM-dependent methyltransferase [Patescibacteria group bacterium]|nr:class I SAM-dependent methyltransferase [Patescibacteria group bacterium]